MEENIYKFDDSKDTHRIGVKKNKFTHHRDPEDDVREFNLSTGWPENGYAKDDERITDDSPSYEGEAWFTSKSFNDPETNKRPLHPTKDYFHHADAHTGDDHLEMGKGNYYPQTRVDFEDNPNTDDENYSVDGKLNLDKKGGEHLRIAIKEENPQNGYIYKINKNDIKMGNLNEQIDRIKQMIQFKDGMSYKDVQKLTEAPKAESSDIGGADEGGFPALKSAEAGEVEVGIASDGQGIEVAASDKEGGGKLDGPSLEDQVSDALNGKDAPPEKLMKGKEEIEAVVYDEPISIDDFEKAQAASEEAPESNFEKKGDDEAAKADDKGEEPKEPGSPKEEAEKVVEKAKEEVEKAEEVLDDAKEDLKKVEDEEKEEPAKEEKEEKEEVEDEIPMSEMEMVYQEIIILQNQQIEYLGSGGDPDSEEYGDLVENHKELMRYYEDLKAQDFQDGPVGPPAREEKLPPLGPPREDPFNPLGPPREDPFNFPREEQGDLVGTATHDGSTYTLEFNANNKGLGTAYLGDEIGTGKITPSKERGHFDIVFNNVNHNKYGMGKFVGTNNGRDDVVYIDFIGDDRGEAFNSWKVPYTISKTPSKSKSVSTRKSPARTTKTAMSRGSYDSPLGMVGVKGIRGRGKSMSPFSEDPFGSEGKVDPSRWKDNEYDVEDEEEKEEINESRGKKVIKLRERDLYRIVEKVIREKRNTKRNIKEYWMQDVSKEIKKDHTGGTFHNWCEKHGFDSGCSEDCIREALNTDDKLLHFRAGLAKAFCHSNHHHQYESRRPRRTLQEKWKGNAKIKSIDKWGKDEISFTKLCAKGKELSCKDDKTTTESKELKEIQFALRSRQPGKAFGKIDDKCKCGK